MVEHCCTSKSDELERLAALTEQRRMLKLVLAINAVMFLLEFGAGVVAGSTALMADSADMFGDATVYGLSIYALARSDRWKGGAALVKGLLILAFGITIAIEIIFKIHSGVPPSSFLMLIFGALALIANLCCLGLLWRYRRQDVNMSSTFECSRNDVISNVSVLVSAGAVAAFNSPWPDIIAGALLAAIFLRSSQRIIVNSLQSLRVS